MQLAVNNRDGSASECDGCMINAMVNEDKSERGTHQTRVRVSAEEGAGLAE